MTLDLAAITFRHESGAERAFAKVRDRARGAAWLGRFAFVECHRHDRIVIRGTFAGHYLDLDGEGDIFRGNAATGAIVGGLLGLAFGPAALAVGLVGGASVGDVADARDAPAQQGDLFDEIRNDVPEGCSAVVLLAPREDVDAMIAAFDGSDGEVVRHTLSDEAVAGFEAAVASAPEAAPAR